jgi:hypothetical protein
VYANLLVGKITSRVSGPQITCHGLRADPKVAGTDVKPSALGATAFDILLFVLKLLHELVGCIGPDFAERALSHVAKAVMPPELIRMDGAIPTHTPDSAARVVPFIHLQEFKNFLGTLWILSLKAQIEVGAVRVIVYGEHLRRFVSLVKVFGSVHD